MKSLHIYNPEHDIALAANLGNFTSPHAGRMLRHDLGFLPAVWAEPTDYVLVDDVEDAQRAFSRLMHRGFPGFVDKHQLRRLDIERVEPWGWDLALHSFLTRHGVGGMVREDEIAEIRELSHRKHAASLLAELQTEGTTGQAWCEESADGVAGALEAHRHIVVKAPWSSSGRGVRFVRGEMDDNQRRWMQNVILRQGCVEVEPYYNKVKDFGMEFESDGEGCVRYLGLSLFHTKNGAYTGNILASEEEKREQMGRYLPLSLLDAVRQRICGLLGERYRGKYRGPFGVDMMIVRRTAEGCRQPTGDCLLHPCVEINLRRTMGHVAIDVSRQYSSGRVMRIEYSEGRYKLRITNYELRIRN